VRRSVSVLLILAAAGIMSLNRSRRAESSRRQPFKVVEATIPQIRDAMEQGRTTSREIVLQYLTRIAIYENRLNGAITVNPRVLEEAEERDRERAQGRIRG
jgi:amidase